MGFASPGWLIALVAVLALVGGYLLVQRRRRRYTIRFTNVALLRRVAPRRPGWRRHVTFALLAAALVALTLGTAQPSFGMRVARQRATVMLAIDVSPSMVATDVTPTRLAASKAGATRFAALLPPTINLGLVKFGGQASVVVPPTLDRTAVTTAIDHLTLIDSTAIGEAVFACLDAISTFGAELHAAGDQPPPAAIVLMSDGGNNAGRPVDTAARAARAAHVPVSTIAFGTDHGTIDIGGEQIPVPADKATLRGLAQATGGSFHVAASAEALRSVYTDLGSQIGYTTAHRVDTWPFLATGLLLALAAAATGTYWTSRLL